MRIYVKVIEFAAIYLGIIFITVIVRVLENFIAVVNVILTKRVSCNIQGTNFLNYWNCKKYYQFPKIGICLKVDIWWYDNFKKYGKCFNYSKCSLCNGMQSAGERSSRNLRIPYVSRTTGTTLSINGLVQSPEREAQVLKERVRTNGSRRYLAIMAQPDANQPARDAPREHIANDFRRGFEIASLFCLLDTLLAVH